MTRVFSLLKTGHLLWKLSRTQRGSASNLRKLQNRKLRVIVKHSYNHVPYYRELFKKAALKPSDVKTVDDLEKIPVSNKENYSGASLKKVVASNIDLRQCIIVRTSGTTGKPLTIYWDRMAKLFHHLQTYRWQMKCGDRVTNRQVVIGPGWIPNYSIQRFGIFKTKHISPVADAKMQIRQLQQFSPHTMTAYPSCVRALAWEFKENGLKKSRIPLIFTGGEQLDEYTRELARDMFDAEIFDGYGANEVGGIAKECVEHIGHHIQSDSTIVEILRSNNVASLGEEGEITVTNLTNFAMPFLRYNLEDAGILTNDVCGHDNIFPIMQITGGRKSDLIKLPNGTTVSALAVLCYCLVPIQGVKQYQVTQEKVDRFEVKIVIGHKSTKSIHREVKHRLKQRLGNVEIAVSVVDDIPREKTGKFKQFKTKLL